MELYRIRIFTPISYIMIPNYFDRMTHRPKDVLAPVVNAGVHSCSPVAPHSSVMLFLLNAGPLLARDRELGRETTSTFRKKEESESKISRKTMSYWWTWLKSLISTVSVPLEELKTWIQALVALQIGSNKLATVKYIQNLI